ncbi:hypothetical protein Ocin01_16321 [Orchesella cincta]|uniref:F-box domain-containing protein n=1 Tax=Orchesella cincta TaxID=48709 RepID=A0A1D2MBS2_ORCCI|nr:hypothetical protein Ocin01_16321 [Orchesella cincta]
MALEILDLPIELRLKIWRYISNSDVLRLRFTCKQINTEITQLFGISSKVTLRDDVNLAELSEFFSKTVYRCARIPKKCVFGDSIQLHDIFQRPEMLQTLEILGRASSYSSSRIIREM